MRPFVIGIAGGSGAGKSTLARALTGRLQPSRLVEIDWYYKDLAMLAPHQRDQVNFDHPDALDWELLRSHLRALRGGEEIQRPVYDFTAHGREPQTILLDPAPLIVIEGILALHDSSTRELMDLRVFVDSPPDLRRERRIRRDVSERGRSRESVNRQLDRTVSPMHRRFVEPSRRYADVFADGSGPIEEALREVVDRCR